MLLAIDVGNTNVTVGVFRAGRLVRRGRMPTEGSLRALLSRMKVPPKAVDGVILSSVVPRATLSLKRVLKGLVRPKPLILGETVRAPIKNCYRIPSQVGQDRLVNAAAAFFLYGGPAIIVDFGTAVTIDLVSARQEYRGGLIIPGVGVALEALVSRAALLPEIELSPPREFLGKDTRQSMRAGLFYGYGALCDGLVSRMKARYAPSAKVIATGGHCRLIAPYCRTIQIVDPDLTLRGLRFIFEKLPKKP